MRTIADLTRTILADRRFSALREYVITATGLEYYAGRAESFAEQIAHRVSHLSLESCSDYLQVLHHKSAGPTELDILIARLTIGETHFFRHRELFDALRDVALPEILERNRTSKRLRIWSAGCSTGAEAYSLSLLIRREMHCQLDDWNVSIVGTDINRPALSQALAGVYEDWAFRGAPPELRGECFNEVVREKSWQISPIFKQGVAFHYHNLVQHPFPSLAHNLVAFDIILCRNVLIYFAPDVARQTISKFAECLAPGGWLAVGHAENGGQLCDVLDCVNARGATLHRKPLSVPCDVARTGPEHRPHRPIAQQKCSKLRQAADASGVLPNSHHCAFPGSKQGGDTTANSNSHAIAQIRSLADRGDIDAALALCRSLIVNQPRNATLHFYSGMLFDQALRHSAAANALGRATYLDCEFVLAHYYLGLVQQKVANSSGAANSFRTVLQLLHGLEQTESLPHADGLKVVDLYALTSMHLETLQLG